MNRTLILGIAIFFAIVGLALVGGENASAGLFRKHGCGGCDCGGAPACSGGEAADCCGGRCHGKRHGCHARKRCHGGLFHKHRCHGCNGCNGGGCNGGGCS